MGRAIVRNPKVFFMDEPLSNLDAKLRVQMRIEISKLQGLGVAVYHRHGVPVLREVGGERGAHAPALQTN